MKLKMNAAAALFAVSIALPAAAQTQNEGDDGPDMGEMDLHPVTREFIADQENRDWFVVAGPVGYYAPEYVGSDTYKLTPLPFVLISYKDRLYADPIRGVGGYLVKYGDFRLGAGVNYAFGRDESDDDLLTGMGDIDGGAAAEFNLEYRPWGEDLPVGPSVTARLKHQFTGSDTGNQVELNAGFGFPVGGRALIRPGVRAEYGDSDYNQAFFGVTQSQAKQSGLARYEVSSGFNKVGASLFGVYLLTPDWFLTGVVSYDRIIGAAADSPVVQDANQGRFILGVVRRF